MHPSSVSWKITPLYFFYLKQYIRCSKGAYESETCWDFRVLRSNFSSSLCQFWNHKLIPLQVLHSSSVSWKITPLYFFNSSDIYFAQKEPIKINFLRLSSPQVKLCQIPHVNFDMTSRFLFKFCLIIHCHDR